MNTTQFERRALSAHLTNPDTPESDALDEVMHDVNVVIDEHGTIEAVQLLAVDPIAAMQAIDVMKDAAYRQLQRAAVH